MNLTILSTRFSGNYAFGGNGLFGVAQGGGVYYDDFFAGQLLIRDCEFIGNSAGDGAGVWAFDSQSPRIENTLFAGNSSARGSAVYSWGFAEVVNCTVVKNVASDGTVIWASSIDNSIVWQNTGSYVDGTTRYSLIQGGAPGPGNIDLDPRFRDPLGGDYRLLPGSPTIDAADNGAVGAGVFRDLAGRPRFRDDERTPDTGIGPAPVVDMGAYEFQPRLRRAEGPPRPTSPIGVR